ncbi:prenyltransferase/squalene oxidase repeat-containing protein [Nannocystis punicea]|uniref:Squalene cyclase C-terminal domain-containing protein n=1 Tax=Nannocystis punicea TaxID=2995304 RepID=A0ABY7GXY8_9BACT|nr:prenyltransferase/squalene oxidase repeat-containing protein [Nannocystis poenicansa]WAS91816.1 hypothetical protein O0S08_37005 [Nannocystis poenicansa]
MLRHFQCPEDRGEFRFLGPASGRVLESALTLHVLRRTNIEPEWQQRLRGFLVGHSAGADPISRLFAAAALGLTQTEDAMTALDGFLGDLAYGRRRKRALLLMLLVELEVVPLARAGIMLDDFAVQAAHRFSQLHGAASRLMFGRHAGGIPEGTVPRDAAFIVACQAANGGWEQQALLTLLAMLALGPDHPAFERGLRFLRGLEREDGGIPFIPDVDVWLNALAGLALQAGSSLPEVRRQVARFLISRQHTHGGWSFTDGVQQTDSDCSALCVELLLREDAERHAPAVDRALEYFRERQRDDGGYPAYERAGESEPTMTANVLLAQCLGVGRRPELVPSMRAARQFIRGSQRSDGRFETSWSLCETYSIFRVMASLEAHRAVDPGQTPDTVGERALRYLLAHQRTDGGWGQAATAPSDALSSAYALAAVSLPRFATVVPPACARRAAAYLLGQQDPRTGAFVSIPDQMGPRPIPYEVPVLSTVMGVWALSLTIQRLSQG